MDNENLKDDETMSELDKISKNTLKRAFKMMKLNGQIPSKHKKGHIPPLRLKRMKKANRIYNEEMAKL